MTRTMLSSEQSALAKELHFEFEMHMNLAKSGHRQEICTYKELTLRRVVSTRKTNAGYGKATVTWYINDEKKEYKDGVEFLETVLQRTKSFPKFTPKQPPNIK